MSQYKREITVAVSFAIIGVVVLAAAASYLASLQVIGPTGTGSTTTCCTTTTSSSSNYGYLAAVVLSSPKVESQTANAYFVSVLNQRQNPANASQLFVEVFVVGNQSVSGGWAQGYGVTYTGREVLNVTVETNLLALQSTYKVDGVSVTNLPDSQVQISFNSAQQQAIRVALSNSSVASDLSGFSYYMWNVVTPISNSTISGFLVQIDQANGSRAVLVVVDPGLTKVLSITEFPHSPWGPFLHP